MSSIRRTQDRAIKRIGGILRFAYVVVTIGGVYCRERVQAGVKWQMSE